jgi:tRNA-2-methylthio-N6-dimethylallyladenosine synthase
MVTVEITYAAPHHLVADGDVIDVRRTRSGDAWEARTGTHMGAPATPAGVTLGMPTLGVPAPLPDAPACR